MLHVAFIPFISFFFFFFRSLQQGNGWPWRRRLTSILPEPPGDSCCKMIQCFFFFFFKFLSFSLCRHTRRIWETTKRTTRQANTEADGDHLIIFFCFDNSVLGSVQYRSYFIICKNPQALESLPCWNERYTKTALLWWSSFALLWDVTLWSFLQVKHLCNV